MPKRCFKEPTAASGFISRKQVVETFGISLSKLEHLPAQVLATYRIGRKIYHDRAEVVAAIKNGKFAALPPMELLPAEIAAHRSRGRRALTPLSERQASQRRGKRCNDPAA